MDILIVKKKYGSFQLNGNDFEGAKNANKCLPYDFVIPTSSGCSLSRRNEHPHLVGILQTTGAKYGFTSKGNAIYLCKPYDEIYPPFYIGSKIVDTVKNKIITFKFDSWPDNSEFPKGNFVDLVGDAGDSFVEKKASLLKASPYKWNKVLPAIIEPSKENRLYLNGFTFNIDPDGCKDVDDCITLWDNSIAISIADVSAFVNVNPWLRQAEFIGTSLYEDGKCVKPMFPRELSEDLMSLVEGKERLAYSLIIKEDLSWHFEETIVRIEKAYTYNNFPTNEKLALWAEKLSGIKMNDLEDSHKIVEILMLYYNTKAGEMLKRNNSGILRKQKGIHVERAKIFEMFSSEYMFLCYESAAYCLPFDDTKHSQLNLNNYAHASSPIRRYVDIINQFNLKGKTLEYQTIHRFNDIQKKAKGYERDLVYIDLYNNKRVLEGIVINDETIFVIALKKIMNCKNRLQPKDSVKLSYYMNPQCVKWKERIILNM